MAGSNEIGDLGENVDSEDETFLNLKNKAWYCVAECLAGSEDLIPNYSKGIIFCGLLLQG